MEGRPSKFPYTGSDVACRWQVSSYDGNTLSHHCRRQALFLQDTSCQPRLHLDVARLHRTSAGSWSGPPASNARHPAGKSLSPPRRHAAPEAVVAGFRGFWGPTEVNTRASLVELEASSKYLWRSRAYSPLDEVGEDGQMPPWVRRD